MKGYITFTLRTLSIEISRVFPNEILVNNLGANILLNNKGEVQIADFGLARNLNSISGHYTSCVVTLWYRAPELLLGSKKYTTQVDIWSMGYISFNKKS